MRLASLLLVLTVSPAVAQDADCSNAMSQSKLNQCAYEEWQSRDADLNAAYAAALALLKDWDAGLSSDERGAVKALKEAQRAWITFRDKACEAEGYAMKGGSAEPLLVYGCMATLTGDRAAQLWQMVGAYDG